MARSQDGQKELDRLERKHQRLKAKVSEYEARLYLTPDEQLDLNDLKKAKLATKDAIAGLRT